MKKIFETPTVNSYELCPSEDIMVASALATKNDGIGYGKNGFADTATLSEIWKGAGEGWI
ncbi:MAG: hypothetical protein J1F63_04720 [Oscillospiraceae bacterium]|nr:hypothetical protein [Oscillospiraceae bacterium]